MLILDKVFLEITDLFYLLTDSYGLSIIIMSFCISALMYPFLWITEIIQSRDRIKRDKMKSQLDEIKYIKNKRERYYYTLEIYKKNGYNKFSVFYNLLGLVVQIPFFLAAYWGLSDYDPLTGESFGLIMDLNQPDKLIKVFGFDINFLPFGMTFINLFGIYLNSKDKGKREILQLITIALIFLILLYDQSSALVLFWLMNNFFATIKVWFFKNNFIPQGEVVLDFFDKIRKQVNYCLNGLIKNNTYFLSLGLITSLCFITFFLAPIQILDFLKNELILDVKTSLKYAFTIAIFMTITICSLYSIFIGVINKLFGRINKVKFEKKIKSILVFLISWVVLSSYIFPLVKTSGGLIDQNHDALPLDLMNLFIVFFLSFLAGWHFLKVYGKKIFLIFLFFFTINIPFNFFQIIDLNNKWNKKEINLLKDKISNYSSKRNLLVVSFDGLQGSIVKEVLVNKKKYYSEFKDFVLYENIISTDPATVLSMSNELFGNINFREFANSQDSLLLNLPKNQLIINQKHNKTVNISTFGAYNIFNLNDENQHLINNDKHTWSKFNEIYYSLFDRILSGKVGIRVSSRLKEFIFDPIISTFYFGGEDNFKNFNQDEIEEYFRWINNSKIEKSDSLSIKYLHFNHTHFPVTFDENGKDFTNNQSLMNSNQNISGLYNQTDFVLTQFKELINKLKDLNIYDKTFIILKSDHGKPTSYFNKFPDNIRINGHDSWGLSRYNGPLLMIKEENIKRQELKINNKLFTLGDLATTIAYVFDQKSIPKGYNLLETDNSKRSPYIYLNIVKDSISSFMFDDHKTIRLNRLDNQTLLEFFQSKDLKSFISK